MEEYSNIQLDAIKEICTIGAGNAATTVSQLVDKKISMSVPQIKLLPISKLSEAFGEADSLVAGIYCKMLGDISGGFLLTFPLESAYVLCDILLKKPKGTTKEFDELSRSALQEVGNIVASTFVGALGRMLNRSLLISIPRFAYDTAAAIADFILIKFAELAEQAVVMEIIFSDISESIKGRFSILPEPEALKLILDATHLK